MVDSLPPAAASRHRTGSCHPPPAAQASVSVTLSLVPGSIRTGSANVTYQTLVPEDAGKYVLVPTTDIGTTWRSDVAYDTTGWHYWDGDPAGVGYDRTGTGTPFTDYIGLDLESEMPGERESEHAGEDDHEVVVDLDVVQLE